MNSADHIHERHFALWQRLSDTRGMNRRTVIRLISGALAVVAGTVVVARMVPAIAADAKSANGVIELTSVWARPGGPTERTVYLDIINHGTTDDRLIGVSSPQAEKCILEKVVWKGLNARNVPVDGLPVPAMARTKLKPGGTYIRALKLQLSGDNRSPLELTLNFASGAQVGIVADISARMLGPQH
jgi:copper(I)-binding protein